MRAGHADEADRGGFPHAGHDGVDAHARIDEHGYGTPAHDSVAEGEEVGPRLHEHDHPLRGPQAGGGKTPLVGVDPGGERGEVEGVVAGSVAPAWKRDSRHRGHPGSRGGGCLKGGVQPPHGRRFGSAAGRLLNGVRWSDGPRRCRAGGPEEVVHRGNRPLGGVFDHEVGGVGDPRDVSLRKPPGDAFEDAPMKAGILHAPNELHRLGGEGR